MRQQKLVISTAVPPSTPSTTSSAQGVSASPNSSKISKALFTVDDQATNKGEPVNGNDPMVMTIGTVTKVVDSAVPGLKSKEKEEILKLAQSSLEKQILTLEAASQEEEDVKLVSLLDQILVRDAKVASGKLPAMDVPSLTLTEKVFHSTKLGFEKLQLEHIVSL